MSNKNKQTFRRYEDEFDRRANKAYKIQQREQNEKRFSSHRLRDIINTDEDDFDQDDWFEVDDDPRQ